MTESARQWTEDQRRAIEARDRNILTAASAGTGKTAVLVERCIRLITDADRPVDIDRLLVVTFTEAAAAEMRNRIAAALRSRIEQNPRDARLRRQLLLLDRASISTIHAFALRVLQQHFFRLGLDPNLDVIDPEEGVLLQHEVLEEVFEELYKDSGDGGKRFRRLIGRYAPRGDDAAVRRAVLSLAAFLGSLPFPRMRRLEILGAYGEAQGARRLEDVRYWYEPFAAAIREDLERLVRESRLGASAEGPAGLALPEKYVGHFARLVATFDDFGKTFDSEGYDALHQAIGEFKFPRWPSLRGLDPAVSRPAKALNDSIRKTFERLAGNFCALPGRQWIETVRNTAGDVEMLLELVQRFEDAFAAAKRERGELDFSDLERLCFELLVDRASSSPLTLRPSETGREVRDGFEAVLVDEYQDINPIQDAILTLCAREGDTDNPPNRFMVGDVKQSIYRFRLAEPAIFQNKQERYRHDAEAGGNLRIDLNANFRSRGPLLETLNSLFRMVLIPEVGGIAYDEKEALRGGFEYPPAPSEGPAPPTGMPVELQFFERLSMADKAGNATDAETAEPGADSGETLEDVEAELEQIEVEAGWTARRIRRLVGDGSGTDPAAERSIWDAGEKRYRPAAYRDVAILLLTATYKADVFVRVLRAFGIPAFTEASSGALATLEMRDMVSLLQVLDNPHNDIAMAAVLRSPIVGLGVKDLAAIRIHDRDADYFSAVRDFAAGGKPKKLREKLERFVGQLDRWRTLARRGPLAAALWTIYDETGYLDYATAMPDGAQRRANLIGLYNRAHQFDEFSRRGLGRFLEFLRRLEETEGELGAPSALSEAENVVRIMSIHKSKGLEFPVVVVPDIGKMFNFADTRGDLIVDRKLGAALRDVRPERGIKFASAPFLVAKRQVEMQTRAEHLRLLYVAATRAREKLVFCGSIDKPPEEQWREHLVPRPDSSAPLDPITIGSARSFADWIGPALARLGHIGGEAGQAADPQFAVAFTPADQCEEYRPPDTTKTRRDERIEKIALLQPVTAPTAGSNAAARIMDRLQWRYPWRPLTEIRGKTSVTELKRRFDTIAEPDEVIRTHPTDLAVRRPKFMVDEDGLPSLTPSEIGTAVHTVFRHLDLTQIMDRPTVAWQVERMVHDGLLTQAEADAVEMESIMAFFQSPIGHELKRRAGRVRRELPFSIVLGAGELAPRLDPQVAEGEWVHLQGVIDCIIERPEGFVILDFKTDRIDSGEVMERAERYRVQMDLYARAAETIFERTVVERLLYFLHPGVAYLMATPQGESHAVDAERQEEPK